MFKLKKKIFDPGPPPPYPLTLRGDGGSRSKSQIFFIWIYFKVWIMGDLELLTESKNIKLLPSTDASKLAPTRAFSGICIGKRGQKMTFRKFCASFSGHQVVKKLRFLARWQILLISRAVQSPFLKILIFRPVAAIFGPNFSQNSEKWAKFSPKRAKKIPKIKIFKNRLCTALNIHKI